MPMPGVGGPKGKRPVEGFPSDNPTGERAVSRLGRGSHKKVPINDWRKQKFLDWLCTAKDDREPLLLKDFAETLQIERRTLTNWKVDPEFLAAWEAHYRKTIGSPERAQTVLETLYQTATDRDDPKHVTAGVKYLEAIEAVKPPEMKVTVQGDASILTDEQLERALAVRAGDELASRREKETG